MTTQTRSLTGKGALVTGGSKGIGAAIVRRLTSDGASVAFTYLRSEQTAFQLVHEVESSGGKALAIKADSASAIELRAAVAGALESLGSLDIFVSNAGILSMGTIETYGLEDFDRMVAINVRGAFIGIQAAAPEDEQWRPNRPHRQQCRCPNCIPRSKRVQHDQGCAHGTCSRRCDRSRFARHHSQ